MLRQFFAIIFLFSSLSVFGQEDVKTQEKKTLVNDKMISVAAGDFRFRQQLVKKLGEEENEEGLEILEKGIFKIIGPKQQNRTIKNYQRRSLELEELAPLMDKALENLDRELEGGLLAYQKMLRMAKIEEVPRIDFHQMNDMIFYLVGPIEKYLKTMEPLVERALERGKEWDKRGTKEIFIDVLSALKENIVGYERCADTLERAFEKEKNGADRASTLVGERVDFYHFIKEEKLKNVLMKDWKKRFEEKGLVLKNVADDETDTLFELDKERTLENIKNSESFHKKWENYQKLHFGKRALKTIYELRSFESLFCEEVLFEMASSVFPITKNKASSMSEAPTSVR